MSVWLVFVRTTTQGILNEEKKQPPDKNLITTFRITTSNSQKGLILVSHGGSDWLGLPRVSAGSPLKRLNIQPSQFSWHLTFFEAVSTPNPGQTQPYRSCVHLGGGTSHCLWVQSKMLWKGHPPFSIMHKLYFLHVQKIVKCSLENKRSHSSILCDLFHNWNSFQFENLI